MRLLLDEMHSPEVAARLRAKGYDVVAVAEEPDLRGLDDDSVLAVAALDGRVVVTENVDDFVRLSKRWAADEQAHAGIVLTTDKRFPRSDKELLVRGLEHLLEHGPQGVSGTLVRLRVPPPPPG